VGSSPLEIFQKQSLYVSYHIPSYVSSNQHVWIPYSPSSPTLETELTVPMLGANY